MSVKKISHNRSSVSFSPAIYARLYPSHTQNPRIRLASVPRLLPLLYVNYIIYNDYYISEMRDEASNRLVIIN